ncbi:copper homeostasis membrane protein CopD [Lichenihabitans sp. PAMC28606]|uniref:copper homeostasis membrane protein CopD n=1 Tax=Lichenihabitans sp. PAMC28606 TaxID=2880932 RepID=UPI001D0A47CF|nr:copper homeostasis membrane protein CopD [Lichenihabitans sp. PAMC28606]UDL94040.1 copper homeostasis membrane protein CopD [Lichenihabitans sp. PAMC28606]
MSPDVALAVCRFGHDAAALALWGVFAFLWALVPQPVATPVVDQLAGFRVTSIAITVITTLAALPLQAAMIGNGWPDAIDVSTLRAVLFETSVGTAWIVQCLAAMMLALTVVRPAGLRCGATALASGLVVASIALSGHAAMHEGALGLAHRLNDVTHLLAGGAWVGALVALRPLLRALDDPKLRQDAGLALWRFSTAGHWAVALVIGTGVANTALVLQRWPLDWTSPYQALLSAKIGLVLVMTTIALVNRYVIVPRMAASRHSAIGALQRGTLFEIALGLIVIALVSIVGLLEPS